MYRRLRNCRNSLHKTVNSKEQLVLDPFNQQRCKRCIDLIPARRSQNLVTIKITCCRITWNHELFFKPYLCYWKTGANTKTARTKIDTLTGKKKKTNERIQLSVKTKWEDLNYKVVQIGKGGLLKENKGVKTNGRKTRPWVLGTLFSIFFFTSNVNVLHFPAIHFRFILPLTRTSPRGLTLTVRIPF